MSLAHRSRDGGDSVNRLPLLLLLLEVSDFLPVSPSPAQTSVFPAAPSPGTCLSAPWRGHVSSCAAFPRILCVYICNYVFPSVCWRIWVLTFLVWSPGCVDVFWWFFRNRVVSQQPCPKSVLSVLASEQPASHKGIAKEQQRGWETKLLKFKISGLQRKGSKRSS